MIRTLKSNDLNCIFIEMSPIHRNASQHFVTPTKRWHRYPVIYPNQNPDVAQCGGSTLMKPLPPLARLSPKSLGGLFISSLLFCWYSLSMVMAARPFPTEPVILDTMPAAPPSGRKMEHITHPALQHQGISKDYRSLRGKALVCFWQPPVDGAKVAPPPFWTIELRLCILFGISIHIQHCIPSHSNMYSTATNTMYTYSLTNGVTE